MAAPDGQRGRGHWAARYADLVIRLRFLVIGGWLALAVGATTVLPTAGSSGGDLGGFVSADNPAIAAEIRSFEIFGFPLLSRVVLVQRDPDGLSTYAQAEAVLRGVAINQGAYDSGLVLGALPVPNTAGVFPGAEERDTTVLTYLFLPPTAGFDDQREAARTFAEQQLTDPDDAFVGTTGSIPARAAQAELIEGSLPFLETATVAAIALIVAICFRSVVAPLVTLFAAGLAALVTVPLVNVLAGVFDLSVPSEIQPLVIALLLGIVTDYCVFFLSGLRRELAAGHGSAAAVRHSTLRTAPIVVVAGLTVAAGTGALLVADSALFRGFGPGLALTVLVGLVVAVTLVPALLAVLGRRALWPTAPRGTGSPDESEATGGAVAAALTRRRTAAITAAVTTAGLVLAALPLLHLALGVSFVESLPSDSRISVAAQEAQDGFAPGILAPTEVLVEGAGVAGRSAELAELTELLRVQRGVNSVIGPGYLPAPDEYDVFLAPSGDAVRLLVVLEARPLGAEAIDAVAGLGERLPGLLTQAGLDPATAALAGDSALSALIVQDTTDDLLRISVAALLANLLMLVLFLRAVLTSLLLLATSVLGLAAALGLTVFVFQDLVGGGGLTFYVPFAAAVLLVSLGSDYNIFAVGRVWDEARRLPLDAAIRVAVPDTTRAVTAAGLTLAASFGLLALVPLRPFRELAFAMAVGILIDAIVVRSLLVPSLLTLLGDWASRAIRRAAVARRADESTAPPIPVSASGGP